MSRTYEITLEVSVEQVGDELEIEAIEVDGAWVKHYGIIYKPRYYGLPNKAVEAAILEAAFKQADADDWSDERRKSQGGMR